MLIWTGLIVLAGTGIIGMCAIVRAARWSWRDAASVLTLLPIALFSVSSYVGDAIVGAGDSQHYALQVADFVAQSRAGVMPVLAGNSAYAFNGNIHTLRTAPYFTHFAGLIDAVTLHRLAPVQLQNLAVCGTSMLAAIAAYFAALHASGRRRVVSWLLAALYVLSPALVTPLCLNDMFATYMAAPWLVLVWFGLAGLVSGRDPRTSSLIGAGALAMTWYAHSPLGAWATVVAAVTVGLHLGRQRGARAAWQPLVVATLLFIGLAAYAWVSVETLGNPTAPAVAPPFAKFGLHEVASILGGALSPYRSGSVSDLQFGLPLWIILIATIALGFRRHSGLGLLFVPITLLLLLLFPWPTVGEPLWRMMPDRLVGLTAWPAQRFYPLLAAGAVIGFAFILRHMFQGRTATIVVVALLAGGVAWNGWQTALVHARPGVAKLPPAVSAQMLSPDNLVLTRYSYALFESMPPTFTHGWTDPEFETRLRSPLGDVVDDNARAAIAAAPAGEFAPLVGETVLTLQGPAEYLFVFAFADPEVRGEIVFHAPGIRRAYTLPASGEPFAFGAGPAAAKAVPLRLRRRGDNAVSVAATAPGVSFRAIPITRAQLPVQLVAQTPFTVRIRMREAGFVETPRVFLDGYSARVNGQETPVRRSPASLVMVPVAAGESEVSVEYTGPLRLRVAWWLSLGCFALWPWCVLGSGNRSPRALATMATRAGGVVAVAVAVSLVVGGMISVAYSLGRTRAAYGSLRLEVKLPERPAYPREPLLITGRNGAADGLFLIHEPDGAVRVGFDHWGVGGPISEPIPIDRSQPHTFEITMGSLYPSSPLLRRVTPPEIAAHLRVALDGKIVFDQPAVTHPASADEIYLGRNPVGVSGTSTLFSGYIMKAERFRAPTP
jgi:hypothetical protein